MQDCIIIDSRIQRVCLEIKRRKLEANPVNPRAFVAHLWVRWLTTNILDVPASGRMSG